jgi:hypothetical protein
MSIIAGLFIAIPIALLYCFIFWKETVLGKYKKGAFLYAVAIQSLFSTILSFFFIIFNE